MSFIANVRPSRDQNKPQPPSKESGKKGSENAPEKMTPRPPSTSSYGSQSLTYHGRKKGQNLGHRIRKKFHDISIKVKLKLLGQDEKGRPIKSGKEDQLSGKKLICIYIAFLLYNLLYITMANKSPDLASISPALASIQEIGAILTLNFLNDPTVSYVFGNALTFFFIACAILLSVDKIRKAVFRKWYMQIIFYLGVFVGVYLLASIIYANGIYMIPFLLILSTLWLIFQSVWYYTSSRGFSTKIETRLVERYSKSRTFLAFIVPIIFVGAMLIISWSYRFLWVTLALDFASSIDPNKSVDFYRLLMNIVIPALYIIVIIITLFLVLEFFLSMKRAETRSMGIWDNFTFSLMAFFLFLWMIFMVTLFLLLAPESQGLWKGLFVSGKEGGVNTSFTILLVEFAISMVFLYWIMKDIGKTFGWRVFFLQKDGLVFIFLAIIMGQSVSRFAIFSQIEPAYTGEGSLIGSILTMDRLIIPAFLIVLLGMTVLVYYIRPQKISMFMRREKESVEEEDRAMDLVLKFLRREFIRKGKKFRVDSIDTRLTELLNLPLGVIHSLITRITGEYVDIILEEETTEEGKVKYIDFIPITERYQDSEQAEKKAQHHLAQQLAGSLQTKSGERQKILVKTRKQLETQKDAKARELISGLRSSFSKQARQKKEEQRIGKTVDFKIDVKEDTPEILLTFLRNEFIYRVKHPEEFPSPNLKILDIANKVEEITRINAAELQSLLEILTLQNPNIMLIENPAEPADKIIAFNPITDLELSDILEEFNPAALQRLRTQLWDALKIAVRMNYNKTLEPIEKVDEEFNPVIKQLLRNLQRMWMDIKHPRFAKPDLAKLYAIIGKLMPKHATGWNEYVATGRTRLEPNPGAQPKQ